MKRFVLIPKILLPLVLLVAFFLPGCVPTNMAEVSKREVSVGEKVTLSIRTEQRGFLQCSKTGPDIMVSGDRLGWSVEPSNGATVINGVFVASKPGTYVVSVLAGNDDAIVRMRDTNVPVTIVVKGTAAEDSAAETTVTEAATTTKPSETVAEPGETTTETVAASTKPDANLMHGVVPIQVTVHTHQATDSKDSYGDTYIEFWNVGELGGEQYAKAKGHWVATTDGVQSSETTFEGTFTGGPNGIIDMTSTSSSGLAEGTTSKMVIQLVDGKQMENPSNGYILQIDNPEAFAEAFNGWKD